MDKSNGGMVSKKEIVKRLKSVLNTNCLMCSCCNDWDLAVNDLINQLERGD